MCTSNFTRAPETFWKKLSETFLERRGSSAVVASADGISPQFFGLETCVKRTGAVMCAGCLFAQWRPWNRDLTFHTLHLAGDVFCCSPVAPPHSERVLIGEPMCHESSLPSVNETPTHRKMWSEESSSRWLQNRVSQGFRFSERIIERWLYIIFFHLSILNLESLNPWRLGVQFIFKVG